MIQESCSVFLLHFAFCLAELGGMGGASGARAEELHYL